MLTGTRVPQANEGLGLRQRKAWGLGFRHSIVSMCLTIDGSVHCTDEALI